MRLLVLALAVSGCAAPGDPVDTRCVVLTQSALDFGEVNPGLPQRLSIPIRNDSDSVVVIAHTSPAPPFGVDASPLVLKAQSATAVSFGFAPIDALLHVDEVTFTQAQCPPQVVQLSGLGAGRLTSTPELRFGFVPIGQPTTRRFTVRNTRRTAREVAITGSTKFEYSATTLTVPALGEASFDVTVNPTGPGTLETLLTVRALAPPVEVIVAKVSALPGELSFELTPPVLELGMVPRELPMFSDFGGALFSRTITIRNTGTAAIDFTGGLRSDGPVPMQLQLVLERGVSLFPGETGALVFTMFAPRAGLGETGWTAFPATNLDPPLAIPTHATLLEDEVCEQALVLPAEVPVGPSVATVSVEISNPGDVACVIDSLSTTPGFAVVGDPTQHLVPAHGSITVQVGVDGTVDGLLRGMVLSHTAPSFSVPLVMR